MTERPELQTAAAIGVVVLESEDASVWAAAVRRAGGQPQVMTPSCADLGGIDGLVMAGGPKIDRLGRVPARDGAVDCVSMALDLDLPVLAIAGGFLALNTAAGGSFMEVPGHAAESSADGGSAYHRIYIAPGGKLAAAVGSGGFVRVNSRHRFGVKEAQKARGLLATAYSLEDGVIEALESPEHRWVIGVQFNPERRGELPPHFDGLFAGLVARASVVYPNPPPNFGRAA